MLKRHYWLYVSIILIATVLSACGVEKATPVVVRPTQYVTETAAAHQTQTHAPPTAGPSPTPTITPTPYMTATTFPDADPDMIVAEVGNDTITLAEFQARVRYERWLPLYALKRRVDRFGPDRVLDLSLPENSQTMALLYTLGNTESMGEQTMNVMLTEQVILREAALRDLELDQTFFDGRVAARIGVELGPGGARPSDWDEAYQRFIEDMRLYTGMTEEQFVESMRALTYYDALQQEISRQFEIPVGEGITAVNVQDMLLDTREEALDVQRRLLDGETITAIAASYGLTAADGATERQIKRSEENLPDDIIDAIFAAEEGEVIGPFATEQGWYVARILDTELDTLEPADIQALRDEFFRQWIVERLDDPDYTTEYDNWQQFVPTDPLPQDLSPMMRDEFFNSPSMIENMLIDPELPTPTPLPLGISPR